MGTVLAWLLSLMRRARFVFTGLYIVAAAGFLYADPCSGWTWSIVIIGGLLCLLFWGLVAFWSFVFTHRPASDRRDGTEHG